MYTYNRPKPRPFVPSLIGLQVPRTSILQVATYCQVITVQLPERQFYAFPIDTNYGKVKPTYKQGKARVKKIDWDNL